MFENKTQKEKNSDNAANSDTHGMVFQRRLDSLIDYTIA